ncbi:MAG: type II/IV secretion system protein, partial [Planctomycetes bacterium]|nr:type II/IV secretion system protein [Planctomycetota bacterium]
LLDMGIEPFLAASTLEAVMAQRLVRTICPACKQPYTPQQDQLPADFAVPAEPTLYRGAGCRKCRNTGYWGRTGIFELMVITESIRERIMAKTQVSEVLAAARANGMHLLREDGWEKVRAGVTTLEEVLRVTKR